MTTLANLRALRKERNITQKALGEAVGVGQSAIANIENGLVSGSLPLAMRIAEHLGVPLAELVGDGNPKQAEPVNA